MWHKEIVTLSYVPGESIPKKSARPFGYNIHAIAPGFMVNERSKTYLGTVEEGLTPRGEAVICHTPMGRFGQASDLTGCIKWLLDEELTSFVTGATIPIDGGFLTLGGV